MITRRLTHFDVAVSAVLVVVVVRCSPSSSEFYNRDITVISREINRYITRDITVISREILSKIYCLSVCLSVLYFEFYHQTFRPM